MTTSHRKLVLLGDSVVERVLGLHTVVLNS